MEIINIPQSDWNIKKIVENNNSKSWNSVFKDSLKELEQISEVLEKDEKLYGIILPAKYDIFAAFDIVPLDKVRVVILGQDPYPSILSNGKCRAIGRAFSVRKDDEIPKSLENMYKEIEANDNTFKYPSHGNLLKWEKQGVFLLNVCLTYSQGRLVAGQKSHFQYQIWMPFIIKVLNAIYNQNPKTVFVLLGKEAQNIEKYLDSKSIVLSTSHPSPLSCYRGFSGSKIFQKINDCLVINPINWNV